MEIKYQGIKKTVSINAKDFEQKLSERQWKFGKHKYLTYQEAVALKKKHQIATSQLSPNEVLVSY